MKSNTGFQNSNNRGKPSSLGSIPNDWKTVRIGDVAEIRGGYAFDSSKFKNFGKYQVIKMSNLYENRLDLSRSQSFLIEVSEKERESLLNENDIIITLTGTVGKRDYGYSYQISDEKDLLLNQRIAKIKSTRSDPKYLFYEMNTKAFLDQFFFSTRGGTGNQANVGSTDLANIKIHFPPIKEQEAIAAVLNKWDRAITLTTQLITQKELRKKWLMQQLLTGKKRLRGFTTKWSKHSYNDLLQVIKRSADWNDNKLYRLLSVRRRSGGIFERESLFGHQILVKDLRTAKKGDFLFSKMQIVHGASALVTDEFDGAMISGSYVAVVAKDKKVLSMEFFDWHSKQPYFYHQTYVSSYGVHIEKMTFDFESFLTLEMKVPSYEEQVAIVNVLSGAERELDLLRQKLDKLKEQRKGLMQVLLTGKKRLKVK